MLRNTTRKTTMKTQKELKEEYKTLLDCKNPDYFVKAAGYIVTLSDGSLFPINKPYLETSFCFGWGTFEGTESAQSMANYASKSEEYFAYKNLEKFDQWPNSIKKHTYKLCDSYQGKHIKHLEPLYEWENPACYDLLNEEDKKRILEGYAALRVLFEKRIKKYLKRYSTSKIRTWTYCTDD